MFATAACFGGVVVPNTFSGAVGPVDTFGPLGTLTAAQEFLFAASEFSTIPVGSQITSIGFRLASRAPASPAAPLIYSDYSVELSTSLVPIGSLTNSFGNNYGPDLTIVRSGPMTIGTNALAGGAGPNLFFTIPFTTPYTYQGGDLLLTLVDIYTSGPALDLDAFDVGPLADSAFSGGSVHLFNVPIAEFDFQASAPTSSAPEPGSGVLLIGGSAALYWLFKRRVRQRRARFKP